MPHTIYMHTHTSCALVYASHYLSTYIHTHKTPNPKRNNLTAVSPSTKVGKWHLGALTDWMTPAARGFNTSFGYLWAYNGYLHSWAEMGCPQFPGNVR